MWLNPDLFPNAAKASGESETARAAAAPPVEIKETREKRIVASVVQPADPKTEERARMLAKLLSAEGRPAITRAVDDFEKAGHAWPSDDQNVFVQMLEHDREERVLFGLETLGGLLRAEPPKRPAVLDARLRRLESFAEETEVRESAARLRRQIAQAGR